VVVTKERFMMPALPLSVLCLFVLLPVSKAYEIEDSVHFGKIASDSSSAWLDNDDNPNIAAATAYYYVSTSGFDANPGTLALPWRTIQKAANTAIPGSTVYVRGGTYYERITVRISGSASAGYVTFQNYPNETAVIDGTGLAVPAGATGLFLINSRSYIIIKGFEIRNFRTATLDIVPVGIHVRGVSQHIQIRNNRIHHIEHNGTKLSGVDAHGIAVYGTAPAQAVTGLIIDGNELFALKLGSSEALVVNGNIDGFSITRNNVHDNNNIGIDAIGFEGVSSDPATDQARNGVIARNTVYNINSYGNPAYGTDRSAGGIYVDGGRNITIERNIVHHNNIGIELASEHAGRSTSYITARNNFIYLNDVVGISLGGYDSLRGRTEYCRIVNNTLFRNDRLQWGNGELQLQYDTRSNLIKNNIFFANSQNYFITNPFVLNISNVLDFNIYFSPGGPASGRWQWRKMWYTGFGAYRIATGKDLNSLFVNPVVISTALPDLHLKEASPAIDRGQNLAVSGKTDIDGDARVQNIIDIGADEVR
jgi:parallel beta-helix repeat protein